MKYVLGLIIFSTLIFSCGDTEKNDKNENSSNDSLVEITDNKSEMIESKPAVCIWNKLLVRKTPSIKGKYMTTISLGEKITFKGETVKDTLTKKGTEFIKIELADGVTGWADKRFIAIDANSFVLINDSKLYKRPDIITATSKKFEKMQFVVVTETKDTWSKVKGIPTGAKWFSEGWVKTNNLTDSEIAISVALLTNQALSLSDIKKKVSALKEIVDNIDLKSSLFIKIINQSIEDLTKPEDIQDEDVEVEEIITD